MEVALELGMGRSWKTADDQDRKSLHCLKNTVGKNVDIDDSGREDLDKNEEHSGENLHFLI